MKIALCTTTIHVPHALKLLRKCSPDVQFFVAVEKDAPDKLCADIYELGAHGFIAGTGKWKCSEAIGWNTLARRNIAFLEAVKWGADVIYSWDDDNIPVWLDHFDSIERILSQPFNGIQVSGADGWFDPGTLLIPPTRHRGIPHHLRPSRRASTVTDARIGVSAGLVIGAGDADATTQIEHKPDIGQVHILGATGVVVKPETWTVFNSQNTSVIRELIPAWFLGPGLNRHDDIFASQIVQRVMRDRDYHVHFGPPFTFHERNTHNLVKDLRAEIDGMENVEKMASLLDGIKLPGISVIDDTRIIYDALSRTNWYSAKAARAAAAWFEDCESVL